MNVRKQCNELIAVGSYYRLATGAVSLGPRIILTNLEVPGAESEEETEQTFTRKQRKEYREAVPAAKAAKTKRRKKASR